MSRRVRVLLVLVGAFAFGLLAAVAKGQDADGRSILSQLRSVVGNLSTPWLLVGFIAGAQSSRRWSAALLGLLATMSALLGFYVLTTLVVDLGGHGFLDDFRKELWANRVYLEGGVLTGPVLGAVGAWWRQTRSLRVSVLVGALMMAEPVVLIAVGILLPGGVLGPGTGLPLIFRIVPGWGVSADIPATSIAVYGAEFGLGLLVVLLTLLRSRSTAAVEAVHR